MDQERRKRLQVYKVLFVDFIMILSVVVIVILLVAIVAGWRVNSNFEVEQNGLVSIATKPTGAKVIIDGSEEFSATDMSKMLTGGEHEIILQKDGYESWSKTISVTPGWLYQLEYPRLFKQDREKEIAQQFTSLDFLYNSPDRKTVIYGSNSAWYIASGLSTGDIKSTQINLSSLFPDFVKDKFNGELSKILWSESSDRILVKVENESKTEWGLINVKDPSKNINLSLQLPKISDIFKSENGTVKGLSEIQFDDGSSERILVLENQNLSLVDLSNNTVDAIASLVLEFTSNGNEIAYVRERDSASGHRTVRVIRDEDDASVIAHTVDEDENAEIEIGLATYNSESYLMFTINNRLYVYKGKYPIEGGSISSMDLILEADTGVIASSTTRSNNAEFFILREGSRVVSVDLELSKWYEYDYGSENIKFLDDFELYRVDEGGNLLEWDFDGTNVRKLVVDKAADGFDAFVSGGDKYLYYVVKNDGSYQLVREIL